MNQKSLNANTLKFIAILAMTLDHILWVVFPGYLLNPLIVLGHAIGRITAPIMCFFIAEGYYQTHNLKKYIFRLFAFALVSHFAYNFAFGIPFIPFQTTVFNQTSVMWALAWGLVVLTIVQSNHPKLTRTVKTALVWLICGISFCADWSCIAVLIIMVFGIHRGDFKNQMNGMLFYVAMYSAVYFFFIDKVYGLLQMTVALSIPFLMHYNGKRGEWKGMKWFFYLYYPLHLAILGVVRILIHGNVSMMIGG